MKVTVLSIGYVGLVQAAVLAEVARRIVRRHKGVQSRKFERRDFHFEPRLTPLVQQNYEAGRLKLTTYAQAGVNYSVMQFIVVGTPLDEDGSADLKYVTAVARTISQHMNDHKLVLDKSIVPMGTADKVSAVMQETLQSCNSTLTFGLWFLLKEGAAIAECMRPERIVGRHRQ